MEEIKVDFSDLKKLINDLFKNAKDKENEWKLIIYREQNCYILEAKNDEIESRWAIEDDEQDELKSHEKLLWEVMNYFVFGGSKYDTERIRITREKKDGQSIKEREV